MDSILKPLLGEAPIDTGSDIFIQAKSAALFSFKSYWYERSGQLDRARYNMDIYEKKLSKLRKAVIADKPDRTRAVFIGGRSPTEPLFQPYDKEQYITREFT